jgi:mRNA interferase MazF
VLVVSTDIFNRGATDLVTIVPITSRARPIRTFLRVDPPEGGLSQVSYLICDQVRTIAKERLGKRLGVISAATIGEVERRLKFLLDLR